MGTITVTFAHSQTLKLCIQLCQIIIHASKCGIPRVSQNEPRPNPNQFLHCQWPLPAVRSHNHNQNSNAIPIIQNSDQTRLILVGFSVTILLDAVVSSHRLGSGVGFIFGDNLPTPCYLYVAATNKIFLPQSERIRDSGTTDFPIVVFCPEWMPGWQNWNQLP